MDLDNRNNSPSGWNETESDWLDELMAEKLPEEEPAIEWEKEPTEDDVPSRPAAAAEQLREEYEAARPEEPRSRGRRGSNAALIAVIVVLVGGMLFAGWKLGSILMNYRRDRSAYSELAENAISGLPDSGKKPTESKKPAAQTEDEGEDEDDETQTVSSVPIQVDWDYLRSVNREVIGWLYCPGTIINYPVVQTSDNDYYLHHGFEKQSNVSGALFADKDSAVGVTMSNLIIYGHNMKDESMFGSFKKYMDRSYYEQNPIMYFLTPDGDYRIDLFGLHVVEGTVDNFPTFFGTETAYKSYIDSVSSTFYWFRTDLVNTEYQMMTLSTCTAAQGYESARLVLHGVMVPIE